MLALTGSGVGLAAAYAGVVPGSKCLVRRCGNCDTMTEPPEETMAQTPNSRSPSSCASWPRRMSSRRETPTASSWTPWCRPRACGGAMPANEMTSGFKVVQERSIRFAKQNAEAVSRWRRARQCQGRPGRARDPEPLRADPDAGLCPAGARARPAHGRGCPREPPKAWAGVRTRPLPGHSAQGGTRTMHGRTARTRSSQPMGPRTG